MKKLKVKIMPCNIGMGYYTLIKNEWVCFCYTWSFAAFSKQWWNSLLYMTDTDVVKFLQYSEKLKVKHYVEAKKNLL